MENTYDSLSKIGKTLMFNEPFYGLFLSTLNKVVREDIPTAGVSKNGINYQLAVNSEFWNSLDTDKKKIGLLKHELLHICFNHLIDRDGYPDHELHNIAADVEINQYLTPDYYPTPDLLLPTSFPELNLPLKAGTKEYYKLLSQAAGTGKSPTLDNMLSNFRDEGEGEGEGEGGESNGKGNGKGKGKGSLHPTWKEFDGLSEADKKLAQAQIAHQIKAMIDDAKERGRGFIPAELQSLIDGLLEIKPPSYDWKSYFRRFTGTSNKIYTKKTRRKLNKRFSENPALKIKTKKKILVGVDTSGSVSNEDLKEFFSEIHHMWKTGVSVTIAEGDAGIHNIYEYEGDMPQKVSGRGGTDMNPFISYFNEKKEYNSLIILTDGFIGSREVNTFKPTLMVICSKEESVETVKENGWGNTLKIQIN